MSEGSEVCCMPGEPEIQDSLYMIKLEGSEPVAFKGFDECECKLVLKRATLDGTSEETRVIVDLIAKDHNDKRTEGPFCCLNSSNLASVSLNDISLSPPVAFKISKGQGPVHIVANMLKEVDPNLIQDKFTHGGESNNESEDMEVDEPEAEPVVEPESSESEEKRSIKQEVEKKEPEPEPTSEVVAEITSASPTKKDKKKKKKKAKKEETTTESQDEPEAAPLNASHANIKAEEIKEELDTTMDNSETGEPAKKKRKKKKSSKKEVVKEEVEAKMEEEDSNNNPVTPETRKRNAPFRRVISENIKVDERLKDNSYLGKKGADKAEYGHKAAIDLIKVRGKDFAREKNKRKRGAYQGGKIDQSAVHSIKFDNWSSGSE